MRWQDLFILAILVAGYLFFRLQQRKVIKNKPSPKRELTRMEENVLSSLKEKGYQLQAVHPTVPVAMKKNSRKHMFTYSGGLMVTKGGRFYLVKIKKDKGKRVTTTTFRHELLLDYLFFRPTAILLFDTDSEKFQEIDFELQGYPVERRHLLTILLVLLIVIGIVFLFSLVTEGGII